MLLVSVLACSTAPPPESTSPAAAEPAESVAAAGAPTEAELQTALKAASEAHHNYESEYLAGKRDEMWPGWYAAYVLGRHGDFATPTELTRLIEGAPKESDDWAATAAPHIIAGLAK